MLDSICKYWEVVPSCKKILFWEELELAELAKSVRFSTNDLLSIDSTRHTTIGADVDLLNIFELWFLKKWDLESASKLQDITIARDYIEIANYKIWRFDECPIEWDRENGIYMKPRAKYDIYWHRTAEWYFFLTQEAVKKHSELEWYKQPTNKQWTEIIKALPSKLLRPENDITIGARILNLLSLEFAFDRPKSTERKLMSGWWYWSQSWQIFGWKLVLDDSDLSFEYWLIDEGLDNYAFPVRRMIG